MEPCCEIDAWFCSESALAGTGFLEYVHDENSRLSRRSGEVLASDYGSFITIVIKKEQLKTPKNC